VVAEVAAADEPFVVLFDHDAGGEPDEGAVVGEDADDVGAAADLAVEPFERVGRAELGAVVGGEGVEGEQVVFCFFEQVVDLRQRRLEPFERLADQLARLAAAVGVEDRADQRGQHRLLLATGVPKRFPQEVPVMPTSA